MGTPQLGALALFLSMSMASVPAVSHSVNDGEKGTEYPAEWRTMPALDDDYEVVQLTTSHALDNKMYLDVDPYVPAMNSVVFMSERRQDDNSQNLYLMSLDDGTFVQLTDADGMDGNHANVSPETEEAFFREDRTIKSVSLHAPYEEKTVVTVADRYHIAGIISLTENGKTIAVSLYDDDEDRSTLATVDVGSGDLEKVRDVDNKVDHVLISPDGTKLLYHVKDKNIIGLVDIDTKSQKILTDSDEDGVHPFWSADGVDAAYAQRANGDSPEKVVNYDTESDEYIKYHIDKYSNHFAMNPAQTTIEGDGSPHTPYIYYYTVEPGDNTPHYEEMFEHGSSSDSEQVHPHAAFVNDTDLIFNSDRDGDGNVYLLRKKS